ncbi:xaa-Pro aminopeptidase 3-like [Stegodyphus dumicola]|uniref:xaa-Pro aminopeptidase 3-like n=1 Tax=Stegodyphus dumicola TaxID=202533 RepID=UPI0015B1F5F5|nr:xaa-Pro aminopeptidase 3-like [Stegodyphus dumicola]
MNYLKKNILVTWKWERMKAISYNLTRKFNSRNNLCYAQPTPVSHAHLLKSNEVTPGLSVDVYQCRRTRLMQVISQMTFAEMNKSAHIVIVPSGSVVYMSENIPYPFRQNTEFLYLSGFKEANCVLILHTVLNKSPAYECTLFVPKQTAHSTRWEGLKMDLNNTKKFLGIDRTMYVDDIENFLQSFAESNNKFVLWYDYLSLPFKPIHDIMRDFMAHYNTHFSLESPRKLLHQLRVIKSSSEAELMRKTCKIAAESMREVMQFSRPLISEAHLYAKMDYECRMRGADHLAFPPVVAGGDRANTIHYNENNQIINDGDMVLMDAGCECHGYSSDMARTWPVNGKFSEPQKELYEVVLSVQEELIKLCEKKLSLDHLFKVMCENLGKGFQDLGLIPTTASREEVAQAAYEFCPHHVSHYLGMDVHDTNLISRGIKLLPGMVVTIEPGVYVSPNNIKVPEKYRGLCIRIEDDILITEDGFENLTAECPKHIDDIEKLLIL